MFWPVNIYRLFYPEERHIWIRIHILHETGKAVLVLCEGRKFWIPQSRIHKIRLKNKVFEVYVKVLLNAVLLDT